MLKGLAKFRVGDGVRFRVEGEEHWGQITRRMPRGLRIKSADGRQYTMGAGQGTRLRQTDVRPAAFGVFVLDTHLDRSLYSDRQAADFWYRYCQAAGWSFGCERVHSLADVRYFLGKRRIREEVIVISGHGREQEGLQLTNGDRLDARTRLSIHPSNVHKLYLFSCCQLGANQLLCAALVRKLRARALVTYSSDVHDDICFIAEPYLLQLLSSSQSVQLAAEHVRTTLAALKTINEPGARRFPLEVFVP